MTVGKSPGSQAQAGGCDQTPSEHQVVEMERMGASTGKRRGSLAKHGGSDKAAGMLLLLLFGSTRPMCLERVRHNDGIRHFCSVYHSVSH